MAGSRPTTTKSTPCGRDVGDEVVIERRYRSHDEGHVELCAVGQAHRVGGLDLNIVDAIASQVLGAKLSRNRERCRRSSHASRAERDTPSNSRCRFPTTSTSSIRSTCSACTIRPSTFGASMACPWPSGGAGVGDARLAVLARDEILARGLCKHAQHAVVPRTSHARSCWPSIWVRATSKFMRVLMGGAALCVENAVG